MIKHSYLNLALAAVATVFASTAGFAAAAHPKHVAGKSTKTPAADTPADVAKPAEKAIEYKELEHNIGAELAIETTFNTVRRGTLVKYTNPGLTIQLGPEAGSVQLEVPAETIRRVSIVTPAPQAATPPQENSSAKKN